MAICPSCGKELPGEFPFCPFCAAPLDARAPPEREVRKTVSVLFCDVVGSTALGERMDPEPYRVLLARYFERMKAIVESHGGTVDKFIGDAVQAVFGIPVAHEDDALRACRAAVEMRDAVPELGLRGRIGVNTGEVVTGTSERLVTGDAVNLAARLEQVAAPGEVLIGETTHFLAREAVVVERVEALELKGKSQPVRAFELLSVLGTPERSHASRFVGRGVELGEIASAWERAQAEERCELLTVVGDAGVGKSRLVSEALAVSGARVVRGRCLPYGDGITYWPVVEAVRQLGGLPSDPIAATALRSLMGESDAPTSGDEIAWAFRKLVEEQAPLIVIFDDLQWGEETFLDLVESTALLSAGASLLLLCIARPELAERRPGWPGVLRLEPLPPELVEALIGDAVTGEVRDRIARAAGGNPLFISEMLAMAAGNSEVEVPPTLKALLAARLDQLPAPERTVLERGAVEGEIFHRGAVQALAPEETQVTTRLAALVRRKLVHPERAQLAGDDGYRFRHLLIRDATYEALPKAIRAELHARFAEWLDARATKPVELDELVGYHLEQAARFRQDLGQPDPVLAERGGERLAAAGLRAQARGDSPGAARLLRRATKLIPSSAPERTELLLVLGIALAQAGELNEANEVLGEAVEASIQNRDLRLEHHARIEQLGRLRSTSGGSMSHSDEELRQAIEEGLPIFAADGDELALARAYRWQSELYNGSGTQDERAEALEKALHHAHAAGDQVEGNEIINYLAGALGSSQRPVDDVIGRVEELLGLPLTGPVARPPLLSVLAYMRACRGDFEEARALTVKAKHAAQEFGLKWTEARIEEALGLAALLRGDPVEAEHEFRHGCELFETMGERGRRATLSYLLAEAVYQQGRLDEAEELAQLAEQLDGEECPSVRAKIMAQRGKLAEAVALAERAAEIARVYEFDEHFTGWLLDVGEVFFACRQNARRQTCL